MNSPKHRFPLITVRVTAMGPMVVFEIRTNPTDPYEVRTRHWPLADRTGLPSMAFDAACQMARQVRDHGQVLFDAQVTPPYPPDTTPADVREHGRFVAMFVLPTV